MFRFSITLLFTAIIAVTAYPVDKTVDETKLIALIEKMGAKIVANEKGPNGPLLKLSFTRWEPAKTLALKGSPYIQEIVIEDCTRVGDPAMAIFASMPNLEKLELFRPAITPAGLLPLKTHQHLKCLVLIDAKIGDAGIVPLKEISTLEELDISGTLITSQAAATLKQMTSLKSLGVAKTKFTGRGALQLKELTNLQELNALNCDFTEKEAIELEGAIKGIKIKR